MHTRIEDLLDLELEVNPQPLSRWAHAGPPHAPDATVGGDPEWEDDRFDAEAGAAAAPASPVPWARQGFEYVKWLQRALNQTLKRNLPVDGNPDSRTLSAIQTLQRQAKNKLVRIGLVGPWTDEALLKLKAPPKPVFAAPGAVGIDCNFDARPYLSCIQKATWKGQRIAFAVRYYSGYPSKNLSRGEAEALSKLGVRCVTVWEGRARDAIGHDNGSVHGLQAFRQAVQCRQPTGTPIYFAVDYEPSTAERPGVARYFEGVRDGLSRAQRDPKVNPNGARYDVGVYGNRVALDLCKAQGIVTWFWQSCSQLTAGGTNQFRWPGVAMHQVACEKQLCQGCGDKRCEAKVDWNESDGHEGGWLVSGAAAVAAREGELGFREIAAGPSGGRGSARPSRVSGPPPATGATPVIMLRELRLAWEKADPVDFREVGGKYRALFARPLPGVGHALVRLKGQLLAADARTGAPRLMTAAEIKAIGAAEVAARVLVDGQSGLGSGSAFVARIKLDGTFETETVMASDGSTRFIKLDVSVDLARGATVSSRLELERIDLEGFLARVDAAEQRKPKSETNLEFLASVRKIFQGGPGDPLAGEFDRVLFRNRRVAPLPLNVGSVEYRELKRFQTLYADGSPVDISHVLTGIEGSPAQQPDLGQSGNMMSDPQIVVTWGGDLGKALATHAYRFAQSLALPEAPDVRDELNRSAGLADLLGDVDGINLGADYDPAKTVKQNLLAYYGHASRRRFHRFIDSSRVARLPGPLLTLQPNTRPPRLTAQARKRIAEQVRAFAAPMVLLKHLNTLSPDQSQLVVSILELDSPEMDLVVDYFAGFLERGLAREP